jgi:hypothetical protein
MTTLHGVAGTGRQVQVAPRTFGFVDAAIRLGIVALTLATAWIHASLGGLLFTLNAVGYTTLAVAMVVPGPLGRHRWLVRLALLGLTTATIAGWVAFGVRFPLAYADKAIEAVLIVVLAVEIERLDGGPGGIAARARGLLSSPFG